MNWQQFTGQKNLTHLFVLPSPVHWANVLKKWRNQECFRDTGQIIKTIFYVIQHNAACFVYLVNCATASQPDGPCPTLIFFFWESPYFLSFSSYSLKADLTLWLQWWDNRDPALASELGHGFYLLNPDHMTGSGMETWKIWLSATLSACQEEKPSLSGIVKLMVCKPSLLSWCCLKRIYQQNQHQKCKLDVKTEQKKHSYWPYP